MSILPTVAAAGAGRARSFAASASRSRGLGVGALRISGGTALKMSQANLGGAKFSNSGLSLREQRRIRAPRVPFVVINLFEDGFGDHDGALIAP